MNEKYQAVIDKLDAEAEKENKPEMRAIEGLLREVCSGNDAACDCVLADGKTMVGALSAMRDVASKRKGGSSCVCIAPDEAEKIIFKYYGTKGDVGSSRTPTPAEANEDNAEPPKSQTVGNSGTVSLFDLI